MGGDGHSLSSGREKTGATKSLSHQQRGMQQCAVHVQGLKGALQSPCAISLLSLKVIVFDAKGPIYRRAGADPTLLKPSPV